MLPRPVSMSWTRTQPRLHEASQSARGPLLAVGALPPALDVMRRRVAEREHQGEDNAEAETQEEQEVLREEEETQTYGDRELECSDPGERPPDPTPPSAPTLLEALFGERARSSADVLCGHVPVIGPRRDVRESCREAGATAPAARIARARARGAS